MNKLKAAKIFPCQNVSCEFRSKTRRDLRRHEESVHEGKRYPCDQCEYKASMASNLHKHRESIHNGKKYPCESCDYKATDPSSLSRHKKQSHSGKIYSCKSCDYQATRKIHLVKHRSKTHKTKFPCDQCALIFSRRSSLSRHIETIRMRSEYFPVINVTS